MANGSFAGGLAQGLRGGFGIAQAAGQNVLQAEQLEMQRKKIDQQLKAATGKSLNAILSDQRSAITETLKVIREQAEKGGDVSGLAKNSQALIQQYNRLLESSSKQLGVAAGSPISPDIVQATIDSAPRPKTAVETAEEDVAATRAQLRAIGEAPPEEREALRTKYGFTSDEATDSFFRALDEHDVLGNKIRTGTATAAEAARFNIVRQRVLSLAQNAGKQFTIETVAPDGSINRFTVGPGTTQPATTATEPGMAGPGSSLTPQQRTGFSQQLQFVDDTLNTVSGLIERVKTNPEDFGAIGKTREFTQGLVAEVSNLAEAIKLGTGGTVDLNQLAQETGEFLGVESIFDPDLPGIKVLEGRLALALARIRITEGNLRGRPTQSREILKEAAENVKLSGLLGAAPEQIVARLTEVQNEIQLEADRLRRSIGIEPLPATGGSPAMPRSTTPTPALPDMTPEDLRKMETEELERLLAP